MLLSGDRGLLDRFRRGDREALEIVFQHYGAQVAKWVASGFTFSSAAGPHRFAGFRSAVDQHDAIHEVFRVAFEAKTRESYSGLAPFEGYLFAITKNAVLKRLRIDDRVRPLDDAQYEQVASSRESPEEEYARREESAVVQRFLSELTTEDRLFVDLRFIEQLPQLTVAEKLAWSRKKVRLKETTIREQLVRFFKRRRGTDERKEVLCDSTPTG